MKSYQPEELFDDSGRLRPELADLPPRGTRRMSANPHTNGGRLRARRQAGKANEPNRLREFGLDFAAEGSVCDTDAYVQRRRR
jgi:xylulose-5-phosphate/fructose-6-phosphate phosphoketolase